jgi:hypothetical protein
VRERIADVVVVTLKWLMSARSRAIVAAYIGSKELLRQFERAKWLKPFVRGNRLTRFDIRDWTAALTD